MSPAATSPGVAASPPRVRETQLGHARAFGDDWVLEALNTTTYRGVVREAHADAIGLPVGTRVDEPAWLARACPV